MRYAVIKSGGKQYRVSEGDIVEVDRIKEAAKELSFKDVLLVVDNENVSIGTPMVENTHVLTTVLSEKKGKKIRVAKYKSKARYRKVIGFRALKTQLKIEKIQTASKKH